MSERDFYEGADYAVKCGALTDTEAFNAVCDDLAKAHTEIERLRRIIDTVHPQMQVQIDALTAERDDWVEQARKAMEDADARVEAARREGIEAAAKAAQKHAVSEGWSNTSALRFRNCIRALLEDGR